MEKSNQFQILKIEENQPKQFGKFVRYHSIENTHRQNMMKLIYKQDLQNLEYIVTEKVHGANLSYITTDGIKFVSASRNRILIDNVNNFPPHLEMRKLLEPKFQKIWNDLKAKQKDLKQLTIFGETFGGHYPHEDVKIVEDAIRVQKEIHYCPQNHFYAFDILINKKEYLDVDKANAYFEKEGIFHAKTLFRGNLEECLKYPNEFQTTIPKQLGLPLIENNICEGVVIKPNANIFLKAQKRLILKNKNKSWWEHPQKHVQIKKDNNTNSKITKQEKNNPGNGKQEKKENQPNDEYSQVKQVLLSYITENRLTNVLSHFGEVTKNDADKVLQEFILDIWTDFKTDYQEEMERLTKKQIKYLKKCRKAVATIMLRNRINQFQDQKKQKVEQPDNEEEFKDDS